MSDYPVTIPDDLLAWGKQPEVAIHFARPWAHDIEALAAKEQLDRRETRALMARLEALCAEAIRAGHPELINGLDTRTAERLNIAYSFETPEGRKIEIGRGKRYTWTEMRAVLATADPKEALKAVDRTKDLLAKVFPGVRISKVSDSTQDDPDQCSSCGTTTSQVMMTTVHDTHHCGACWARLTDATPMTYKRKNMTVRGKR
jgi:hypothetical protein